MLVDVLQSNGYPDNFVNNCFKMLLDNKHRIQEKVATRPKKHLFLVFLYLGPLSFQTRTKLKKPLNCCKLQIVFKSQNKLAKTFRFQDYISKELASSNIYEFHCWHCSESYYGECTRHLNVRIGEQIRILPLTKNKAEPSNPLVLCNHSPCLENFSVLTK